MQRFFKGWLPAVALALALAAASAGAVSLEGRIGMAGSNYNLTEGKTEYAERAVWTLGSVRAELPVGTTVHAHGQYQAGRTTKVEVTKGAPASDQRGSLSRITGGAELLWHPTSTFSLGVGLGYLSETQTHTWKAEHPDAANSPVFSAGQTLDWTWNRTTTGLLFTAAVALDTGAFELTGRVGYAPNLDWRETTKAERDNLWEEWTPAAMKGSGGTYEMEGSLQLTSVLSLVAGVEGIVQQSAKVASLAETYKNSAGDSEEHTVTDLPKAFDHRYAAFVGLRLRF